MKLQKTGQNSTDFLDNQLKNLADYCFQIDTESKAILGIIAKHGPLNETQITKFGKRRTFLSRDVIRYRLLHTQLNKKNDFLSIQKGKPIGNLPGKIEKKYSLTFKGILASLNEVPLQENFWIKNYVNNLNIITTELIGNLFLEHMYYSIICHFIKNSQKPFLLTNYSGSQNDLFEYYDDTGELYHTFHGIVSIKGIPSRWKDLFIFSGLQFYILCELIANLLLDTKISKQFLELEKKNSEYLRFKIIFFEDWVYNIFNLINSNPEKLFKKFPQHQAKLDENEFFLDQELGQSSLYEIDNTAKKMYEKLSPNGGGCGWNVSLIRGPTFKRQSEDTQIQKNGSHRPDYWKNIKKEMKREGIYKGPWIYD